MKMIIFLCQVLSYLQQVYTASAVFGFLRDEVTPKVSSDEHFFSGGLIGAACIQALVVWHGDLWRRMPTPTGWSTPSASPPECQSCHHSLAINAEGRASHFEIGGVFR